MYILLRIRVGTGNYNLRLCGPDKLDFCGFLVKHPVKIRFQGVQLQGLVWMRGKGGEMWAVLFTCIRHLFSPHSGGP